LAIWRIVVYLLLPYALGNLIWRALRYPAYWHRWPERFGFVKPLTGLRTIWVHAVSVGEVRSAAPLVAALVERNPKHRVVVTTMTPTGSQQVRDLLGERVSHCYVPYDSWDAVRRFLDRVRPEAAIIAETEFWPNIFAECGRRRIPLLLVNGRVSQASLRGYLRVPKTTRAMLANADLLCAQTALDAPTTNLGARRARACPATSRWADRVRGCAIEAGPCGSQPARIPARSAKCSRRSRSSSWRFRSCCSCSCRGTPSVFVP
jgi:3-deoxy-D-manno-octulosonic-acid transferase